MVHSRKNLLGVLRQSLRRPAWINQHGKFHRDEDGALLPMTIILLTVLLLLSGVALDFMRFEARRTEILAVMDRAALAAASLTQELDPKLVVEDYLKKAGLDGLETTVTVEQGDWGEWRRVRIDAVDTMQTSFMSKFSGLGFKNIDTLSTQITSQAEEAIGNVEVSMVLDISGSMGDTVSGGGTRISALKSGAETFVEQIFDKVQPDSGNTGKLSISIVPYNQQVVLGSTLAGEFNLSSEINETTCGDVFTLPTNTIAISPSTPIQRTMAGDSFDYRRQGDNYTINSYATVYNCPENSYAVVLPFSDSKSQIESKIDNLSAGGDTAIDVGARWGLALLDPAAQPVVDGLINAGVVDEALGARPYDYDPEGAKSASERSMKVMVLMTDGQNTGSYSIKPAYRTGASFFYSSKSATAFSAGSSDLQNLFWHDSDYSEKYYRYSDGEWYTQDSNGLYIYTQQSQGGKKGYNQTTWVKSYVSGSSNLSQIDWSTVWGANNYTHAIVTDYFIRKPYVSLGYNISTRQLYEYFSEQSESSATYPNVTSNQYDKDSALIAVCAAAKAKDILIYTLAVDAPSAGAQVLKSCSSGDGYYYDITSDELTNAFSKIASSINSLRLTN